MMDLEALTKSLSAREALLERVRDLLVDQLHVRTTRADIQPDIALFGTGLCLDSIDAVELLVCLESGLGVRLPEGALATASMRTVGSLVEIAFAQGSSER